MYKRYLSFLIAITFLSISFTQSAAYPIAKQQPPIEGGTNNILQINSHYLENTAALYTDGAKLSIHARIHPMDCIVTDIGGIECTENPCTRDNFEDCFRTIDVYNWTEDYTPDRRVVEIVGLSSGFVDVASTGLCARTYVGNVFCGPLYQQGLSDGTGNYELIMNFEKIQTDQIFQSINFFEGEFLGIMEDGSIQCFFKNCGQSGKISSYDNYHGRNVTEIVSGFYKDSPYKCVISEDSETYQKFCVTIQNNNPTPSTSTYVKEQSILRTSDAYCDLELKLNQNGKLHTTGCAGVDGVDFATIDKYHCTVHWDGKMRCEWTDEHFQLITREYELPNNRKAVSMWTNGFNWAENDFFILDSQGDIYTFSLVSGLPQFNLLVFKNQAVIPDNDLDDDGVINLLDLCNNGSVDWVSNQTNDFDGDGCHDVFDDSDDDNDGVQDSIDIFPFDYAESIDTDSDGIGDNADLDDDGDGLTDMYESREGLNSTNNDTDADGILDNEDVFPLDSSEWTDFDSDGIGDNLDDDDDNDGLLDLEEYELGTDPLNPDTDLDGYTDDVDYYPLDQTRNAEPEESGFEITSLTSIIIFLGVPLVIFGLWRVRKRTTL